MFFTADTTALIFAAIQSILLGNNGYADIGTDPAVADAVRLAGFTVIATTDLFGRPVFRGFTPALQAALAVSPFGVSTYKPVRQATDGPDYEAAILARNDRHLFA